MSKQKTAAWILGSVVIALITISGFIAGIPFAFKWDVDHRFEDVEKKINELKVVDQVHWDLKNQDGVWLREVLADIAVVRTDQAVMKNDVNYIKAEMQEIKALIKEIDRE